MNFVEMVSMRNQTLSPFRISFETLGHVQYVILCRFRLERIMDKIQYFSELSQFVLLGKGLLPQDFEEPSEILPSNESSAWCLMQLILKTTSDGLKGTDKH